MEKSSFDAITSDNVEISKTALKEFIKENSQTFQFQSLTSTGQWSKIWNKIFQNLKSTEYKDVYSDCLSAIRILSRDKTYLNDTITLDQFNYLLNIANIGETNLNLNESLVIESLKCLCNLIYNSTKCQEICNNHNTCKILDGIFKRIMLYKTNSSNATAIAFDYYIKFFDMKLLFLITALNQNTRQIVNDNFNGVVYLNEFLDELIIDKKIKKFDEDEINLICEILKVLFNLTVRNLASSDTNYEEIQLRRLTVVLQNLLQFDGSSKEKFNELVSNVVNLLTNIPSECMEELMTKNITNVDKKFVFENYNMTAISVLLGFLQHQLDSVQKTISQYELLSPILTVLVKCVRCNSLLRRYVRSIVLPPLKDVKKRPEEGTELRNHLCRLLTTPSTQVRDLSAELLFIICKENVGRMIKHTGYGNAAGLLANRGLLGGRSNPSCEYSSDSEDSDTEEYKELQHGINPVLGCYEPPRPNPLEGMTEEQKEYEAMKLVTLMDKLNRHGVVQPCRIGPDGRPVAVDHILQLQDEIPNQQMDHKRKT